MAYGMFEWMYGMMGGYGMGFGLGMLSYMAIAAFIFSLIFWYTYKIVVQDSKKK